MARSSDREDVPAYGVYLNTGAPDFGGDLTDIGASAAAVESAEVATIADLPATGNWVKRTIWVDEVNEPRWWDGANWVGPLHDTGWLNMTINAAGWSTPAGQQIAQARKIGQVVYFRGILTNTSFSGGYTKIGTMPAGIPTPASVNGATAPVSQNTNSRSSVRVNPNGDVQMYVETATGAFFSLSSLSYPVG